MIFRKVLVVQVRLFVVAFFAVGGQTAGAVAKMLSVLADMLAKKPFDLYVVE